MRKKKKVTNPQRDEILIANRHACCVCSRGNVQVHHINGNNSDNRAENLAVLCQEHHDKATAPQGLTARLTASQIYKYKQQWEDDCRHQSVRMARSRTAFFMVNYKNAERIRQLYSQLSYQERLMAYEQLRVQLQGETVLRKQQGFDVSLEPTTEWNPYVEWFVESIKEGSAHPSVFAGEGHPKDPLYPVIEFSRTPPRFVLYDVWCQIMVRAILIARRAYDLDDLMSLEDPLAVRLDGRLVSFSGELCGNVAYPGDWKDTPISKTRLTVKRGSTIWQTTLSLKTHYIYSETAANSLGKGRENGIVIFRSIDSVRSRGGNKRVKFACTPLITGYGALEIP